MARDLDGLKAALAANARSVLPQWFPEGIVQGRSFCLGSVGGERGMSLKVDLQSGRWRDWASGESGSNLLELYMQHHRIELTKAYDDLAPSYGLNGTAVAAPVRRGPGRPPKPKPLPPEPDDVQDIEIPTSAPPPQSTDPAVTIYRYLDMAEQLLYVVYRRDLPDGGKKVWPLVRGVRNGKPGWYSKHPPAPKALYNLPGLVGTGDMPVFLVSGEKCVDALRSVLSKYPVLTWAGGDQHVSRADWSPLAGRKVWYWPDADESGAASVDQVGRELSSQGATVSVLAIPPEVLEQLPEDKRRKADVADLIERGLYSRDLLQRIVKARRPWSSEAPAEVAPAPVTDTVVAVTGEAAGAGLPIALGMIGERAAVLDQRGPTVHTFTSGDGGKKALGNRAALADWERSKWATEGRGRITVDYDAAANEYFEACMVRGQLEPDRVRGKGVYLDGGRVVANLCREGLLVDGALVGFAEFQRSSRHYYVCSGAEVQRIDPMTLEESAGIAKMVCGLRWADPFYGVALAGWLATAPITGAMPWRANLWLSGQSGSGKSTIMNHLARPLLSPVALQTQGNTTEAGVRQRISGCAIPVLWDEFEAESERDNARRQAVMELVRLSTQGMGEIHKGSAGGGAGVRYTICATWLFASVNTQQQLRADARRILNIELAAPSTDKATRAVETAQFVELERQLRAWDERIGHRWVWRAVSMVKVINRTRRVLVELMTGRTTRATADQIAPLLAGYWSLLSDQVPTEPQARELIESTYERWVSTGSGAMEATEQPDEFTLLDTMLDMQVNVTLEDGDRTSSQRVALRELVAKAADLGFEGNYPNRALSRFGLRVCGEHLLIANRHPELKRLLSDTPWAGGWRQVLARIPGALRGDKVSPRSFHVDGRLAPPSRGVMVPLSFCRLKDV